PDREPRSGRLRPHEPPRRRGIRDRPGSRRRIPRRRQLSAIAVYSRQDGEPLGPEDIGAAQASAEAMAGIDLPPSAMEQLTDYEGETSIEQVSPAVPLAEEAAQAVLTLPGDINGLGLADAVSDRRDAGKE